jgi:hypothetical protein
MRHIGAIALVRLGTLLAAALALQPEGHPTADIAVSEAGQSPG